jgi:hypothetical protein
MKSIGSYILAPVAALAIAALSTGCARTHMTEKYEVLRAQGISPRAALADTDGVLDGRTSLPIDAPFGVAARDGNPSDGICVDLPSIDPTPEEQPGHRRALTIWSPTNGRDALRRAFSGSPSINYGRNGDLAKVVLGALNENRDFTVQRYQVPDHSANQLFRVGRGSIDTILLGSQQPAVYTLESLPLTELDALGLLKDQVAVRGELVIRRFKPDTWNAINDQLDYAFRHHERDNARPIQQIRDVGVSSGVAAIFGWESAVATAVYGTAGKTLDNIIWMTNRETRDNARGMSFTDDVITVPAYRNQDPDFATILTNAGDHNIMFGSFGRGDNHYVMMPVDVDLSSQQFPDIRVRGYDRTVEINGVPHTYQEMRVSHSYVTGRDAQLLPLIGRTLLFVGGSELYHQLKTEDCDHRTTPSQGNGSTGSTTIGNSVNNAGGNSGFSNIGNSTN